MLRRLTLSLGLLVVLAAMPAAAQQQIIVRTNPGVGLLGLQNICLPLLCQVVRGLDGSQNQLFLVQPSLLSDITSLLNGLLGAPGVAAAEPDQLLSMPLMPQYAVPNGLYQTSRMQYYGASTWAGFVQQPAMQIIRAQDAQSTFQVSGAGIVATIDTGVDPTHPVLKPFLLSGYDFTRNTAGGSELPDATACSATSSSSGLLGGLTSTLSSLLSSSTSSACTTTSSASPAYVQQSTVAVVDQSTVAVVEGNGMSDFGHGTMVAGVIHLVAPTAKILPLKAFQSDGTGTLSNILRAIYYAEQNHANVINMSFEIKSYSPELARALHSANNAGIICVAAAGNDGKDELVYPAALSGNVMGIASTSDADTQSSFSNYGSDVVWIAAPGEDIVSTYPFGTYAAESGTSFSTPFVSGAAALLFQLNPKIGQYGASQALAHAKWISPSMDHGRLDVYHALDAFVFGVN
ncbi:MAG TPA: S8 family serine peptidase [Candidatus Acidoferrales bacterium]|nr:S8 family serine peptidase [Candidatus Acidoferrales bacterium]